MTLNLQGISPEKTRVQSKRGLLTLVRFVTIVSCLGITLGYAATMVLSHFSRYDDEGFMLFTLRQVGSGTPLYDGMYTEYGPFYYFAVTGLLAFGGLPITHDVIRLLTIAAWTSLAVGFALCAWFWGRSVAWSVATLFTSAVILTPLRGEPGHPQLLIHLLVLASFGAVLFQRHLTRKGTYFLIGTIIGAILMTKINVGIFMLLSWGCLLVVPESSSRILRMLRPAVIIVSLSLPTVLMYRHFSQPAALAQCAVFTFAIVALLYVLRRSHYDVGLAPFWTVPGVLLVVLATMTASLSAGTTLSGLLTGVLFQPMAFSRAIPFQKLPVTILLLATLACGWSAFMLLSSSPAIRNLAHQLRVPVGLGLALMACINPATCVWLAPAVLWLFFPGKIDNDQHAACAFVISTATFGLLIAYPVNGTQVNLSASLVLLAAVGGALLWRLSSVESARKRYSKESVACAILICLAVLSGMVQVAISRLVPKVVSGLPHSSLVRLPPEYATVFHQINNHMASKCEALVTIPGMNSFHLWSGVPRATPYTLSAAMVLFDAQSQEELLRAFAATERPCVLYNPRLEEWSERFRPRRPDHPFTELVKSDLVTVYSRSGYEIRVPRSNVAEWLP